MRARRHEGPNRADVFHGRLAGSGAELYSAQWCRIPAVLRDERAHLAHLFDRQISLDIRRHRCHTIILRCAPRWVRPWPRSCNPDWNSLLYRRRKEARRLERVMLALVGLVRSMLTLWHGELFVKLRLVHVTPCRVLHLS